jgi:flagellar M-ring protein FliF
MATATAQAETFLPATAEPGSQMLRASTADRRTPAGSPAQEQSSLSNRYSGGSLQSLDSQGLFGPIRQAMTQPAVKKLLPLMLVALALLSFALVYALINAPNYRPVVTGVTEGDQQAVFEALRAGEFKPIIDAGTGQITVPSSRYHEARIFLASKGLPKTAAGSLDSFKDQSSLTSSQFMEQVRYNAVMEQEMARSILKIESIQSARVHLATTKPSVFVRDRTPPKASVVLTPHTGRSVSPMQVQAIVHLVASSVPSLTPENVVVVDNVGKLMTEAESDRSMGMNAGQTKHKQAIEELYRQRVIQILSPIVGEGNVRSQVNLTLDFSQTETTVEDYDNQGKGVKTRSETKSEDRNSAKESGGVPGSLSNTVPSAPTTSTNTSATPTAAASDERGTVATRSTQNYEMDRSVRHTKSATGNVQRMSVAVVINERAPSPQPKNDKGEAQPAKANPFSPEEVARMQELVRGVVGFDETRKDVVSVVQAKFETEAPIDLSLAWHKDEAVMTNIKSGFLGLLFVVFLLLVVRPVIKHMMNRDKEAAEAAATTLQLANTAALALENEANAEDEPAKELSASESLEEMKAKMKQKKSNISAEMLDTANTYDDKVALIRMIVSDDSARVASVLKNMIKPG